MIILYVLKNCPYCIRALELLKDNKIKYTEIVVENNEEKELYKKQNGMNTFPQIFMKVGRDNYLKIGGYDNLIETLNTCVNLKESSSSIDSIYHMYKNLYKK